MGGAISANVGLLWAVVVGGVPQLLFGVLGSIDVRVGLRKFHSRPKVVF